ncbi:MAG: N-acetyl-gamma-glutamyl-phosphate reductase [Spirochaetales bacterium]|nr:N-acetyl-gamma-glutamyl-phosphate reductase [Spirochaetales bacterium]
MYKIGVYGASGYMGGEAVKLILEHPQFELAWATSRSKKPIAYFHRNLLGSRLRLVHPDEIGHCDAVLFSLPSGNVMQLAPGFIKQGTKVIDLGADFRLKDKADWERVYGKKHSSWEMTEQAVYGIAELYRNEIKQAKLIANPGCFSSSVILALAPLIKHDVIETETIVVDGLSGTAGAGAELDRALHHPELGNNILPYNVVDHRHIYEMEQELGYLTCEKVCIHFTPAYVPITRGILCVIHVFPKKNIEPTMLFDLYQELYKDEYFIKIMDMEKQDKASWQYLPYPWVAAVSGTNYCHIGFDIDQRRNSLVIFSVLDSVGKGGAHAAVQNLNIMFGLDETLGLTRYGSHPY